MKIRSAVLEGMGLPRPYAQSRPLTIAELDLEGPGAGEVLVQVAAPAFATPICPSSTATGPARRRCRSGMRLPAS